MSSECLIVTQCFYPDTGGIEGLMTALADNCSAAGREVTVLADRIRGGRHAASNPVKPYAILRFGGPRPWRRWRKRSCLARILETRSADIAGIFADSWKSIEALPPSLQVPVSVLAHGMEFPPAPSASKRRRISEAFARCDAVIANSAYTAGLAAPYLGAAQAKLRIIHPPVTALPPPAAPEIEQLKARIGAGHSIIATVARLEPRKGIDAVIKAMPEILRQYPGCVYLVAGAGAYRPQLEALAASLGVQNAVVFLGHVGEAMKSAVLSRADVFAMPVRREGRSVEGFGISYLEAGWFGVACLAGRDGGAADAVLDAETGLVCDGSNQSEITGSLLLLLANEPLRKRLGDAARERVKTELAWPASIERYLSSFQPRA